jgi:phage major head subunit gpT-like protein
MAVTTPALLQALFQGFRADYQRGLQTAPSQWREVATLVPSAAASNTYGWLGQFPALREWAGQRVLQDMAAHGYSITNKLFEGTVGIPRTSVEDDSVGVYRPLFEEMGRAAGVHPDELVFALLAAGASTLCYDGKNFFDTDHPVYPNVDGTGVAISVSNYDVPAESPGATWYLLDTSRAIKPLIFQERTKPELESKTDPANSDHVFENDEYLHGVRYRCNAGFGFWQMAHASRQQLDATHYGAARAAMRSIKADGGRPLGITPNLLVVPPELEAQALRLLVKDESGGNPWAGSAKVLVCPWSA